MIGGTLIIKCSRDEWNYSKDKAYQKLTDWLFKNDIHYEGKWIACSEDARHMKVDWWTHSDTLKYQEVIKGFEHYFGDYAKIELDKEKIGVEKNPAMIKLEGLIEISTGSELHVLDAFKTSRARKELQAWSEENSVFYKISDTEGYTIRGGEGKIKIKYLTTNPKLNEDKIFTMFKTILDDFAQKECKRIYSHMVSLDWRGFEYKHYIANDERTDGVESITPYTTI